MPKIANSECSLLRNGFNAENCYYCDASALSMVYILANKSSVGADQVKSNDRNDWPISGCVPTCDILELIQYNGNFEE